MKNLLVWGITKNELRNTEEPGGKYKSCCFHYLKGGPPKYICENDDYNNLDCYPKDKKGQSLYEKMRFGTGKMTWASGLHYERTGDYVLALKV